MEKCIEETKTLRKKGYSNPRNKAFCQGDYLWNERNEESDSLFHLAMNKKHVCQKIKSSELSNWLFMLHNDVDYVPSKIYINICHDKIH